MIDVRPVETDSDLERCVEIFNAAHPDDGIALEDFKQSKGSCLLHPGGGYAYTAGSSIPDWQYTMVRVRPEARRQGIGSALLAAAAEVARAGGKKGGLVGRVVDPADDGSRAWAASCGFQETRQDVELLRHLRPGDGEVAEGIVLMRAEHLRGAYAVEVECVPDVPATVAMAAEPFERWHELIAAHAVTFVALDDGRVVGYATLEHLHGMPQRLEHGLTAVLRSHRGLGIATKLKRAQIAWAAANGYSELITATDTLNLPMRRVNVKLGYVERLGAIVVEREL
jgi:GNAT superfamily N-acetyltransferase